MAHGAVFSVTAGALLRFRIAFSGRHSPDQEIQALSNCIGAFPDLQEIMH